MRRFGTLLLALLAGVGLAAQQIDTGAITALSTGSGCTAVANSCASFTPPAATSAITLQVSGTFTATVTFEATSDGVTWFTITGTALADGSSASTATAAGQFAFSNSGITGLRARCTAYTSGTVTVTAARGYATARWLTPFFKALTFTNGTALSDSALGAVTATGAAVDTLNGTLTTNTTTVCTGADVTEDTLWTYTLPAATLNANGRGVRVTAWGSFGATANSKTVRPYFGATVTLADNTSSNAGIWRYTWIVIRTGATAQSGTMEGAISANLRGPVLVTSSETMANAIVIKVTGQNGTAAANDICLAGSLVETLR